MKKIVIVLAVLVISVNLFADVYDDMAQKLSSYAKEDIKKIAVIPFSYTDNTSMTKDGSVISERLTVKLINLGRFEIIERSQLDKVLSELRLQASGTIDASSAKELGKVLGVDAIITGTLIQTADGKIEVNARIIKTETAQAIGAVQEYVVKDWIGGETPVVLKPVEEPTYQPTKSQSTSYSSGSSNRYGFFEFIAGFGSQKADLTADSSNPLPFPGLTGNWTEITNATINGAGPIGIRVGGFGKSIIGGDLEISFSKYNTPRQTISWSNGQVLTMPDGFISVSSFEIGGDLLFRTMTKAQLYFGFGLGFSIDKVSSTYLKDRYNAFLNEISMGITWRVPIGFRFTIDKTTLFLEWRLAGHYTDFDRGDTLQTHKINVKGSKLCFGVGSRF